MECNKTNGPIKELSLIRNMSQIISRDRRCRFCSAVAEAQVGADAKSLHAKSQYTTTCGDILTKQLKLKMECKDFGAPSAL